jgi:hypothetical protein
LHVEDTSVGSLNVYRFEPCEWTDGDVAAIRAHATIIDELLAAALLARRQHTIVDQLSTALANRVEIDRATGIVMGQLGVDAAMAFRELRLLARSRRIRVRELADEVIAARRFPSETS